MKPGDSIDRFIIVKKLGHGGMGGVFIGFDPQTDSLCAIKVLIQEYSEDPAYVKRFEREAEILSRLVHPNIVQLIDSGVSEGRHYMALEHVKGRTLGDYVISDYRFDPAVTIAFTKECLRALAYSHNAGVVHRDIKPENIMIPVGTMSPKILDFGIAYVEDALIKTQMGKFVGTLTYASPEQVQGQTADGRADLYSMGLVMYEMLTERKGITSTNQMTVLQQQLDEAYVSPSQINPTIPQRLSQIVLRALRADPRDRYPGAEEFLMELEDFESQYREMAQTSTSVYDFPEFEKQFREANAAFESKDYQHAQTLAHDLSQKAPRAAEVFFLLGKIYMETGFAYNAIEEYVKATAFNPNNVYYHLSLGLAYQAIGAIVQARSAFQTALSIDPNSQVVKLRMSELEKSAGAGDRPGQEGGAGTETPEEEGRLDTERAVILKKLESMRGRPVPPTNALAGALFWWGFGVIFCARGSLRGSATRNRLITATLLQITGLVLIGYCYTHPAMFKEGSVLVPYGSNIWKLLNDQSRVILVTGMVYLVGTLYYLYQAWLDTQCTGRIGYVIPGQTVKNYQTINLGSLGGVRVGQVFYIFAPRDARSSSGKYIGRLYVKEVEDEKAVGIYHPETSDRCSFGDLAIGFELLSRGLVDPRQANRDQFLDIPQNLRRIAHRQEPPAAHGG